MSEMLLRCPSCQKEVNLSEEVNVDILNTITHKSCTPQASIKDSGTLEEIIDKYPFFESILHPLANEPLEEEQSK